MHKSASALVQEWCDEVLFATYKVYTKVSDEGFSRKKARGIGTGERVIYTDGRSPASDGPPSVNGYSVGRWEDGALVVETTHYTENNSGLAQGLASGSQKRLMERFELIDEGAGMRYSYVMEDPEYLAEPVSGDSTWDYRPDLSPDPVPCDLESAGRYLTE